MAKNNIIIKFNGNISQTTLWYTMGVCQNYPGPFLQWTILDMRKIGNMSGLYRPSGVSSWFNVYFWLILRPFFLAGGGVNPGTFLVVSCLQCFPITTDW